jgi:anti-sigma regulatory factor (Ser/Thr protein kinase)/DNA-binding NarL/FixJ family response regulator
MHPSTPKANQPHEGSTPLGAEMAIASTPAPSRPVTACVVVLDAETITCDALASYLRHYHPYSPRITQQPSSPFPPLLKVTTAYQPQQAATLLAHCEPQQPIILLADKATLEQSDLAWLHEAQARLPQLNVVLMAARYLEDCFATLQAVKATHFMSKTVPFDFDELSTLIHLLLHPEQAEGLAPYVPPGVSIHQHRLTCSDDIMTVFMALQDFFADTQVLHPDDLATAMIEAITNAIYHATPDPTDPTRDKYEKGQLIERLAPDEDVTVSYATLADQVALCISDQKGRLRADKVLYWLERNMTGDNLLNTHGRGLFLMYTLCHRLVLHLHPGRRCDVVVMALRHNSADPLATPDAPKTHPNKPLLLYQTNAIAP